MSPVYSPFLFVAIAITAYAITGIFDFFEQQDLKKAFKNDFLKHKIKTIFKRIYPYYLFLLQNEKAAFKQSVLICEFWRKTGQVNEKYKLFKNKGCYYENQNI